MYRPLIFLVLGFTLLLSGTAVFAQSGDVIGIYFDSAYTQTEMSLTDLPAMITGYLVLKNPSSGYPVNGWECCAEIDGGATFTTWELEGQTINILDPPCFTVGIGGDPLPFGENVLLATFQALVTEPTPVIFSLENTFFSSIPDEMAYLSGANGDQLFAMHTATGLPQVASINENTPWPEVSPAALNFGIQPIGSTTLRNLTVTNVGGGLLFLDVSVPDTLSDFFLPSFSGETYLPGGGSITFPVAFQPSAAGMFNAVLSLGPMAPEVPLQGVGREGILAWELLGNLDFPDVPVGYQTDRQLQIINTGEVPIPVTPSLDESCSGFQIADAEPFVIQPAAGGSVTIYFQPPHSGAFACDLDLGQPIGTVPMTGMAHDPVTSFTVTPDSLDFGEVVATTSQTQSFTVQNTGETTIPLDVTLTDPAGYYHLDSGGGIFNLIPGQLRQVTVIFAPQDVGQFDAMVNLGAVVPPVPVTGQGTEANPDCQVSPPELGFGTVPVGGTQNGYFFVNNVGNVPLVVEPLEDSPHFHILSTPQTIEPGASRQFVVYFMPQAEGFWECDISLGGPGCLPVHCSGTGDDQIDPPDDNLVGIFFDSYYTEIHGYTDGPGVIQGYLVFKGSALVTGLKAWECRHVVEEPGLIIDAQLMGQALNVGTPPDYIVGLGEPLPPTPDVHLATFTYLIQDIYQHVVLTLDPVTVPSLPGHMAFISWDDPELIQPMFPYTGYREVAFINDNPLEVATPAEPVLSTDGAMVQLSWDLPAGSWQGYHVYRREETGQATRLTTAPGAVSGDQVSFSDLPTGFAPGTTLFYSYSLINNGSESPRSGEVRFEVRQVPVRTTRLLANVPNPFNPQTTIRFELARAGAVRLSIFDLSGRLIRTLAESNLTVGGHERIWQGRDDSGRQAPSGAYYVRLETPDGVDHRKIMLLK